MEAPNSNSLKHFQNFVIFQTKDGKVNIDGELQEDMVCRNFRHTTQHGAIEGKTQVKEVKYYNLKAILAVGYRVNSHRAINRQVMNMKDWDKFLVQFLELSDYPILLDKGKISMLQAKLKAEAEFDQYRIDQDKLFESDFDRFLKLIAKKKED